MDRGEPKTVAVEQVDRDAAAATLVPKAAYTSAIRAILAGNADTNMTVQAFARHRVNVVRAALEARDGL